MIFRLNKLASACDERVSDLRAVRVLGDGLYGCVLLCRGVLKGREIAVAVKETYAGSIGEQERAHVDEEARLALRMGRIGAGPAVHDLFYAEIPTPRGPAVFQYILMEPFPSTLGPALHAREPVFGATKRQFVVAVAPEMLKALRRVHEAHVECHDAKTTNLVVRRRPGRRLRLEVKMIDFGLPHCDISREKDCAREKCRGLRADRRPVFVLMCAQVLFLARGDLSRADAAALMKSAEQVVEWRDRAQVAGKALVEIRRNESIAHTYHWYKNRESRLSKKALDRLTLQVLRDLRLDRKQRDAAVKYLVAKEAKG
jgi:hypothetical protein